MVVLTPFEKALKFRSLLLLAVLSGLLLSLSLPVRGLPVLLFAALVPLLVVEDHIHQNRSKFRKGTFFLLAFITFLIWNTAGSWWLKNASIGGALMAIVANTILMTFVFQLFHGGRRQFRGSNTGYLALCCYWLGFEHIHHYWEISYPWLSFGNGFSAWPVWVQWYEYTGILGGSVWVLIANMLVYNLVKHWFAGQRDFRFLIIRCIPLLIWILVPLTISLIKYYTWKPETESVEVVLVQPNNDPYSEQYTIPPVTAVNNFLDLARPIIGDETDFVIGPESMIQESLWERHLDASSVIDHLKSFVNQHQGTTVIAGASSFRMVYKGEPMSDAARELDPSFVNWYSQNFGVPADSLTNYYDAFNLGLAVDTSGITGLTHKSKLVVGVERMPYKRYLESIAGDLSFNMGGTRGTLRTDDSRFVFRHNRTGTRYGVAICYESVYGNFFGDFIRNGAQYMFIITNDGWWGNTPGHRQHNAFASLRAIETRRDIARSANTGITCFINSRGDILQPTRYWEEDAIKGRICMSNKMTFYTKYGDYIGRMALVATVLLLLIRIVYTIVPLGVRKR